MEKGSKVIHKFSDFIGIVESDVRMNAANGEIVNVRDLSKDPIVDFGIKGYQTFPVNELIEIEKTEL